MEYPCKIQKDKTGYFFQFIDHKNISGGGSTIEEALKEAYLLLNEITEIDLERGFDMPEPSKKTAKNIYFIPVRPSVYFSMLLKGFRKKNGKSLHDIADALGISRQAYEKYEKKNNISFDKAFELVSKMGVELPENLFPKIKQKLVRQALLPLL